MRPVPWRTFLFPALLVLGAVSLHTVWQSADTERLAMTGYASHSYQWPYLELEPAWIAAHTGSTVAHLTAIADPRADDVEGQDPWGNQFVKVGREIAYSTGPNGVDEGGQGDDVAVYPYWLGLVYRDAPAYLFLLACVLAVATALVGVVRVEPTTSGVLGCCFPTGFVVGALALGASALVSDGPRLPGLVVPGWAAALLSGTCGGTIYMLAVVFVWSRRPQDPTPLADPG